MAFVQHFNRTFPNKMALDLRILFFVLRHHREWHRSNRREAVVGVTRLGMRKVGPSCLHSFQLLSNSACCRGQGWVEGRNEGSSHDELRVNGVLDDVLT